MAVSFANRLFVSTATTGTSSLVLGAAQSGYRGTSTLADGAVYNYSIVDGSSWEDGQGVYTAASTTLTRATIYDSSNAGSVISLSGSATVIVGVPLASDLNKLVTDDSSTWPFFKSAWGGNFLVNGGGFNTLPGASVTDTHNGWNATTYIYTVPQTGVYQVDCKVRVADGQSGGDSNGCGVDYANQDSADFFWSVGNGNRNGMATFRTDLWTAGTGLRFFAYFDGFSPTVEETSLVIYRVR